MIVGVYSFQPSGRHLDSTAAWLLVDAEFVFITQTLVARWGSEPCRARPTPAR